MVYDGEAGMENFVSLQPRPLVNLSGAKLYELGIGFKNLGWSKGVARRSRQMFSLKGCFCSCAKSIVEAFSLFNALIHL